MKNTCTAIYGKLNIILTTAVSVNSEELTTTIIELNLKRP